MPITLASVYKKKGKNYTYYKIFSEKEISQSSTWRKLEAIRYRLICSKSKFENNTFSGTPVITLVA